MDKLPHLQDLIQLQHMTIENSEFTDVSGLSDSSALETLKIYGCAKLERLPSWQRLASLKGLKVVNCPMLTCSDPMVVEQVELKWNLERLELENCGFYDLRTLGSFPELERLEIESLSVTELPDLSDVFPRLRHLELKNCASLERLTNRAPVKSLCELVIFGCGSLAALPDLCEKYPGLSWLALRRCHGIISLSSSGPTRALTMLVVDSCNALTSVLDLAMFPALEELDLSGCRELKTLSCSVPLTSLTRLKVTSCQALKAVSDLAMFPALEELDLHGCSELEALSISVPGLTALKRVDVRRCNRLRRDDVKLLQAIVCPECVVVAREEEDQVGKSVSIGVDQGDDMGRIWRYQLMGWCAVLASVGIVVFAWKRKCITW